MLEFHIVEGVRRAINSTEEFSGRVAVKSKPDRKFRKVSYIVAYVDATASFI